ncbi:hypothetical protein OTU49_012406, partial [Cherax quadricarinatus]
NITQHPPNLTAFSKSHSSLRISQNLPHLTAASTSQQPHLTAASTSHSNLHISKQPPYLTADCTSCSAHLTSSTSCSALVDSRPIMSRSFFCPVSDNDLCCCIPRATFRTY